MLAALGCGVDLVALVRRDGAEVDAWTLDPTTPGLRGDAAGAREALGCDQITTNDPETIGPMIEELLAC